MDLFSYISAKKILGIFQKNWKLIFLFFLGGFIIGSFYVLVFFKPTYKTVTKVLLKNPVNMVSEVSAGMDILKSDKLAKAVWKQIKIKKVLNIEDKKAVEKIKKAIHVKNFSDTSIIQISVYWNKPETARNIALVILDEFEKMYTDFAKKDVTKTRMLVEAKLKESEKNLLLIRNEIKNFRQKNSSVDLELEAENLVSRIKTLENRQQELQTAALVEAEKIAIITKNLGIKSYDFKNSPVSAKVVENTEKLAELQDELAGMLVRYKEIHPAVKNIKARINRLEKQIQDQTKLNLALSDPANMAITENLVNSRLKYSQLSSQSRAIGRILNTLKSKKSEIPVKQFTLVNHLQQESEWSSVVNNLRSRLVDAELEEAGITSTTEVIAQPILPKSPIFPARGHILFMITTFFGYSVIKFLFVREFLKNNYDNADQIEKDLKTPVLSVIPWIDKDFYNEPDIMYAIEETASYYSLAYQRAVSNMRIRGFNADKRVLAFTSAGFSKFRSTIIMNIAYGLNRTGQSVVIVDADFRTPSIEKELGFNVNRREDLADLLTIMSADRNFDEQKINLYLHSIPKVENFYVIPNCGSVCDPGEYLYSKAFGQLLNTLKTKFDWVLVDVPPAKAVPDAMVVGTQVDGMVVFAGLETNKSVLRKLSKEFNNYNINIFGIIAREIQPREMKSANEYIRQIFQRMMPRKEGVLVD